MVVNVTEKYFSVVVFLFVCLFVLRQSTYHLQACGPNMKDELVHSLQVPHHHSHTIELNAVKG